MKKRSDLKYLPFLYILLGLLAAGLRLMLYAAATDDRGLLTPMHPLWIALTALTVLAAIGAVLMPRFSRIANAHGVAGGLSSTAFAVGLLYCLLTEPAGNSPVLASIHRVLGVAAALGLIGLAFLYLLHRPPYFLMYCLVCLFLCIQMVMFYQLWSEHPQLQDYVYGLGAVLCMVLFVYQRAAAGAGLPESRLTAAFGLMGIFFCLSSLPQGEQPVLFAAGALWLTGELTRLTPNRKDS